MNKFRLLMPMSGRGTRFAKEGIPVPKPWIMLADNPMWGWSLKSLPLDLVDEIILVQHKDYPIFTAEAFQSFQMMVGSVGIKSELVTEETPLRGAAISVLYGLRGLSPDKPLVVANCDQVYSTTDTFSTPRDVLTGKIHGLIPCFPSRDKKWSYAILDRPRSCDYDIVKHVVEKPDEPPKHGLATVGVYYFASTKLLTDAIEKMVAAEDRVNGEYYLAPSYNYLQAGSIVGIEYVDQMYGLGTPEDIDIFVKRHRHLGFHQDWRSFNGKPAPMPMPMPPRT